MSRDLESVDSPTAISWPAPAEAEVLDVVLPGNIYPGVNQERNSVNDSVKMQDKYAQVPRFEHLDQIIRSADLVIPNISIPVTEQTLRYLGKHSIAVAMLASSQNYDTDQMGIPDAIDALATHGVRTFGAGRNLAEAQRPLRILTGFENESGALFNASFFARYSNGSASCDGPKGFATPEGAGYARLVATETRDSVAGLRADSADEFIVVLPHWRRGYNSTSSIQRDAKRLVEAGASMVIGYGGHVAQEIHFSNGRLILNVAGDLWPNFTKRSNANGRPAFSMITRLTMRPESLTVRVYPFQTGDHSTNYQPRPVDRIQFEDFYRDAFARTNDPHRFLEHVKPAEDEYGHVLAVELNHNGRLQRSRPPHRSVVAAPWDSEDPVFEFDRRKNTGSQLIERELRKRGIRVRRLTPAAIVGRKGDKHVLYTRTSSHQTSYPSTMAARYKHLAREILADAGLTIARGGFFSERGDLERALDLATTFAQVVVKPVDGNRGRAVTVGLSDPDDIVQAWHRAFDISRQGVLVEEGFEGAEGRFIVVSEQCLAVTRRIPPFVVGDGVRSIRELILAKNRLRYETPHLHNKPILLDRNRLERLHRHGLSPLSVLRPGQRFVLDFKGGLSTGAENADITDQVHPSFLEIASRATRAFPGLDLAGIDILAHDFRQPATPENHIIVEVNNQPGIGSHHFPATGTSRNIAGALVEQAFKARPKVIRSNYVSKPAVNIDPRDENASLLADAFKASGLDVNWWSRNFFIARSANVEVSVVGSATDRTSRAAVTATQHPLIAKQLLQRARVPLPVGRIFKVQQRVEAREYAASLGTVSLRASDRYGVLIDGAESEAFESAWSEVSAQARRGVIIVERSVGREVCFLVSHGHALAALERDSDGSFAPVVRTVDRSYRRTAAQAALAFPGLDLCEVVVVANDLEAPATTDNHEVTVVRSAPDLVRYARFDGLPEDRLFHEIVHRHLTLPLPPQRGSGHKSTEVSGALSSRATRKSSRFLRDALRQFRSKR